MNYVYSTLTCNTTYAIYGRLGNNSIPTIEKKIMIRGGHLTATNRGHLHTPYGVVTEVDDEDLALLLNDYHFKEHMENGFIKVEKRKSDPEKIAKAMTEKDGSSQVTPGDLEKMKAKLYDKDKLQ